MSRTVIFILVTLGVTAIVFGTLSCGNSLTPKSPIHRAKADENINRPEVGDDKICKVVKKIRKGDIDLSTRSKARFEGIVLMCFYRGAVCGSIITRGNEVSISCATGDRSGQNRDGWSLEN